MTPSYDHAERAYRDALSQREFALVFIILLLVGCTKSHTPEEVVRERTSELRQTVNEVVVDAGRARDINLQIDRVADLGKDYLRTNRAFADELQKLNADYVTPRQRFEEVLIRFETERKKIQADFLRLHFDIVSLTTASEWEKIAKSEIKALEAVGPLYGVESR